MKNPVLEIKDLNICFHTHVVQKVSLSLVEGNFTSLVGETGSGKSVTALSICRLLKPSKISGIITYRTPQGEADLLKICEEDLLRIRGAEIAYIFQDPASSLNPVLRVGEQVTEAWRVHSGATGAEAKKKAMHLLESLRIADPERVFRSFPHELSGGMKQRAMIAAALIADPKILIADEPTTALDVMTEKEILELLVMAQNKKPLTIFFITHHLSLAMRYSDSIYVMEKGRVVECLTKKDKFSPRMPYTKKLFDARNFTHE